MISWGTIKSLLIFFGPILLPKAISYYRSVRAAPVVAGKPIRPAPPSINRALAIIFAVASVFLLTTLPYFSPENIFKITQSRLQIPTDVLFTRLNAMRPQGLTERDNVLRHKLVSLESRLLYFKYGPDAIANCMFCTAEDVTSYLYYAIPSILAPHLFNLCVVALATSGLLVGKEASSWRTRATIGAVALAGLELWLVSSYNHQENARATRLEDVDTFHWKLKVYRGVALAAMDGLLGWVIWLSATNRAFVTPHTTPERIESATRLLESTRSKLGALGILKNTIPRDEGLRTASQMYWVREGNVMREVMEDREVIEGVHNALENRINVARISEDAGTYAGNIVGGLQLQSS